MTAGEVAEVEASGERGVCSDEEAETEVVAETAFESETVCRGVFHCCREPFALDIEFVEALGRLRNGD